MPKKGIEPLYSYYEYDTLPLSYFGINNNKKNKTIILKKNLKTILQNIKIIRKFIKKNNLL